MTKQDKKTKSKQSILASSKQESAADVKEVKESQEEDTSRNQLIPEGLGVIKSPRKNRRILKANTVSGGKLMMRGDSIVEDLDHDDVAILQQQKISNYKEMIKRRESENQKIDDLDVIAEEVKRDPQETDAEAIVAEIAALR